jgi:hypothetical protein
MPRKRYRTIPRTCEECGTSFFAYPYEVRDGLARFCSRRCGKRQELAPRVLPRLGPPTERGCRPWTGNADQDGYGIVSYQGRNRRVTHAVWFLNTGHWPLPGEVVAHTTCDWPPCGEFAHLTLMDNPGNVADRDNKGHQVRGEQQHLAKLTAEKVLAMRARYAEGGVSMPMLAAQYGVSYATARSAINGETWKHLTATPPPLAAP